MTGQKFVSSLFHPNPRDWSLRGDPYLWEAMEIEFREVALPEDSEALAKLVEELFLRMTGQPISASGHIYCKKFAHGGMSSGGIVPSHWRLVLIPLLSIRFLEVKHGCEFWMGDRRGLIRQRRCPDGLHHPEIWKEGKWETGSSSLMDAITGMGGDSYSCGEMAMPLTLKEAIRYAADKDIDLFGINPEHAASHEE